MQLILPATVLIGSPDGETPWIDPLTNRACLTQEDIEKHVINKAALEVDGLTGCVIRVDKDGWRVVQVKSYTRAGGYKLEVIP